MGEGGGPTSAGVPEGAPAREWVAHKSGEEGNAACVMTGSPASAEVPEGASATRLVERLRCEVTGVGVEEVVEVEEVVVEEVVVDNVVVGWGGDGVSDLGLVNGRGDLGRGEAGEREPRLMTIVHSPSGI